MKELFEPLKRKIKSLNGLSQAKFNKFAQKNRIKYAVKPNELWPINKLYTLLEEEQGGFILIFNIHSCLGIKVEQKDDQLFDIYYRDPFYPDIKKIEYNIETKETKPQKLLKFQWFGKFSLFEEKKINPSLQNCAKYKYELHLPEKHRNIIQSNTYHCGDICAYLAKNCNVTLFKEDIRL